MTPNGRRSGWPVHAAVLLAYLAASVLLFGTGVLTHLRTRMVGGVSSDSEFFLWALTWWPHAIGHGIYPFFTHVVYAPSGFNLAWATGAPAPAIAMAPITTAFGPVASFDLLSLLAPALSAWTAYLLCRHVTGNVPASIAGGAFFGFSPYVVQELLLGHLNLSLVFLVPVCVLLVLRRIDGSLGPVAFVAWLGVALALQFGISTEVFATLALMGGMTWVVAVAFASAELRRSLLRTGAWILAAYGVAVVLVGPYLYAALAFPRPTKPLGSAAGPADLDSLRRFVLPGTVTEVGHGAFDVGGNGTYLGVAFVVLFVSLIVVSRRSRATWLLAGVLIAALVLSLGPSVRVGGVTLPLPWRVAAAFPFMRLAAPSRLVMYAYLAGGVGLAIWAAERQHRTMRWALVLLALALVFPNVTAQTWSAEPPLPSFFSDGGWQAYAQPGRTFVIVADRKGDQMYWQAVAAMGFPLAGGYLGARPPGYAYASLLNPLSIGAVGPGRITALRAFIKEHRVGTIVVAGGSKPIELLLRSAFGVTPSLVDGVRVYVLAG